MTFDFYALRFHFEVDQPVSFAPGAANTLRGAFGYALRRAACLPGCTDAAHAPACGYERFFEPVLAGGPSGFADPPRPFVLRADHLSGAHVPAGATFAVDMNVFDMSESVNKHLVNAFSRFACEGVGGGRARLVAFESLDLAGVPVADGTSPVRMSIPLQRSANLSRVRVDFLTPTELKDGGRVVETALFPVLLCRLRDRISTLRATYGAGPLTVDYRALAARAAAVKVTGQCLQHICRQRRSSRTQQTHGIGGFTGFAEYEGALGEFMPYLDIGQYTGVGRHTVWGNGRIAVSAAAS